MKLDMNVLRDLLIYVETHGDRAVASLENIELASADKEEVAYHVKLAHQDGLLDAVLEEIPDDDPDVTHLAYTISGLTMRGHKLLAAVEDPAHWRAIKGMAQGAGVATTGILYGVAESWVKMKLGIT